MALEEEAEQVTMTTEWGNIADQVSYLPLQHPCSGHHIQYILESLNRVSV